ncbi:hypothetical protein RJ639_006151 [Escallonia herrerae]|uniref:MULE transposase domain-containing protein n=1 Tax=Escallonia herrerae TaxID=1293975 RepID=A0AA88VXX3_9ASTE|nr:hypothetical protein RJ639_006151 [Escallonia herrerae]
MRKGFERRSVKTATRWNTLDVIEQTQPDVVDQTNADLFDMDDLNGDENEHNKEDENNLAEGAMNMEGLNESGGVNLRDEESDGSFCDSEYQMDEVSEDDATEAHASVACYYIRIYICLGGLKKGFLEQCRPVIGLDGCFLKGVCEGQILTAVGVDANNGMFLVAYTMVEVKSTSTWTWFLELLVEDLRINDGGWTFLSNKQKGLLNALQRVVPNAEQRNCAKHMFENYKTAGGVARGNDRGAARGNNRGATRGKNRGTTSGNNRGAARGNNSCVVRGSTRGIAKGNIRGAARGSTRGVVRWNIRGAVSGNNRGAVSANNIGAMPNLKRSYMVATEVSIRNMAHQVEMS